MSRIIDNQHFPSDVVGGMVLGVLIAVMYILRAIPRYRRVLTAEEERGGGSAPVEMKGEGGLGHEAAVFLHAPEQEGTAV